jgi:23S rRNA (guanosine2251-2'-O)-methyltransferase
VVVVLDTVPLVMVTNLARSLNEMKEREIRVIGASDDAERTLYDIDLAGPVAMVLGAEGKGLRRLSRENCDVLARLDMPGAIRSLNVSNACAVALAMTHMKLASPGN